MYELFSGLTLQESLRTLFRGPCCVRSPHCKHLAGSIPQSTAKGVKAGRSNPHSAAPPRVGALVRLRATDKNRKKHEERSRSSGREILAAWKSAVQPSFYRARFLARVGV